MLGPFCGRVVRLKPDQEGLKEAMLLALCARTKAAKQAEGAGEGGANRDGARDGHLFDSRTIIFR